MRIRLTRRLGTKPPGTLLDLPAGQAQSLVGAGRAVPADGSAPAPAPPPARRRAPAPSSVTPTPEPPRGGPRATQKVWLHHVREVLGLPAADDTPRDTLIEMADRNNRGAPPASAPAGD